MRASDDSAVSSSSFFGRAVASARSSVQSVVVSFAKVRLNPLVPPGERAAEAAGDIATALQDAPGRSVGRRDIVDETRAAVAGERLPAPDQDDRWRDFVRTASAAIEQRAGTIRRDVGPAVAAWGAAATAAIGDQASKAASRLAAAIATVPRPPVKTVAAWLAAACFVALPLIPEDVRTPGPVVAPMSPPDPTADAVALPDTAVSLLPEHKPAPGTLRFSRTNLRYCIFQQVRLEAIGPITFSTESDVYNALIADWNARCAKFRFTPSDKDPVDAEVKSRRAMLEAEGRTLVRGWQRKIETTLQRMPAPAPDTGMPVSGNPPATPVMAPPEANLPAIITLGETPKSEINWGFNPLLKTPSLVLLRPDAATRVQERLNELGYAIKPTDGNWGPTSRNALRRFKEANGLLWNDGFDIETVARLFSASATRAVNAGGSPATDTVSFETAYAPPPGSGLNPLNRADAERIQRRLAALGYYTTKGYGLWGTASRKALRAFKAANDLADDDEWDAMTESVLNDEQGVRVSAASIDGVGPTGAALPASTASPAKTEPSPKSGIATKPPRRAALPPARDEAPRPPATVPLPARPPSGGPTPTR
jgi:hypothetical protein